MSDDFQITHVMTHRLFDFVTDATKSCVKYCKTLKKDSLSDSDKECLSKIFHRTQPDS